MTKQEIEKYAEEKAQEFKEQIIKELSEKIEEQYHKPYLIKNGEFCWKGCGFNEIAWYEDKNEGSDLDNEMNMIGLVARTKEELREIIKARQMQREYELWCMEYPCDWKDYEQEKNFICGFDIRKLEFIGKRIFLLEEKPQGTICCANKEHIQAFIDKVGKENFVKYVLEIGLKKYWLEV